MNIFEIYQGLVYALDPKITDVGKVENVQDLIKRLEEDLSNATIIINPEQNPCKITRLQQT